MRSSFGVTRNKEFRFVSISGIVFWMKSRKGSPGSLDLRIELETSSLHSIRNSTRGIHTPERLGDGGTDDVMSTLSSNNFTKVANSSEFSCLKRDEDVRQLELSCLKSELR